MVHGDRDRVAFSACNEPGGRERQHDKSMGSCKKDVTPLLMHWSYIFLALVHQNVVVYNASIRGVSCHHWVTYLICYDVCMR